MGRSTSRATLRRVAIPSALRARPAGVAMAGRRAMVVRAEEKSFDFEKALQSYKDISYKIPPVVSAVTVPVVLVSLLAKTLTGTQPRLCTDSENLCASTTACPDYLHIFKSDEWYTRVFGFTMPQTRPSLTTSTTY
jgi:hypothetical protein